MAIKEMEYAPSGSIFTNDRKRGVNDPDYNGYLKITSEVLDYLVQNAMGRAKSKHRLERS